LNEENLVFLIEFNYVRFDSGEFTRTTIT
jgi:hypothetical protein